MKKKRYTSNQLLFMFSVSLFQLYGHNIISYIVFFITVLYLGSFAELQKTIRKSGLFIGILSFFLIFGSITSANELPSQRALMVWGQFLGLTFLLAALKKKPQMILSLKAVITILFLLDIFTNILLFSHIPVPWAEVPPIRPGEAYARLGGFYDNALYSGALTVFFICFYISPKKLTTADKWLLFVALINLLFSGSYRYFSVLLIILFVKLFQKFRYGNLLVITIIGSTIGLVISTFWLSSLGSNGMRLGIWIKSFNAILNNIFGKGFYSADLPAIKTYSINGLFDAGVTESGVLLIGMCFGVIGLLLTLWMYLDTFGKVTENTPQITIYCLIFTFFSLCFTGFLENSLDIILNALSIYIITNQINQKKHAKFKCSYSNIQ